ncbi:MAG: hypothetical protein G01um101466_529 [Parcubacteria group bacterium Gr01-1014_66]|nr:MAG: hypothetical protein G01um101466_529 [Parcubacteria group bacterium Gr01-1014_66]
MQDIKDALRRGESLRLSALRMLHASIQREAIARSIGRERAHLDEAEVTRIVRSEIKKRRDAAELFVRGGRNEQAAREEQELQILKSYLPSEVDDTTIRAVAEKIMEEEKGIGTNNFGRIMQKVMARLGGNAEGNRVRIIVQEILDQQK